jgi:uncharacterized cofD-like protein
MSDVSASVASKSEPTNTHTPENLPAGADSRITDTSLRVVAIGGGTGLSTLLRGLKRYVAVPQTTGTTAPGETTPYVISDLAAVVTVSDDGGSSGRLRKDLKMLAPGDLRNCLVALSEDSHLLSQLFQYRFASGEGLEGHSFGNLFLAALSGITGDFAQAVKTSSQILATRGHIYPATREDVTLAARMDDGSMVHGETSVTASKKRIIQLMLEPAGAKPLPETLDAIARADLITMGPGSLYTSLITNLLVDGIAEAIANAKGVRIYICNMMTQANESLDLTASQHLEKIMEHARYAGVTKKLFDYALVNTAPVSQETAARYAGENQVPVEPDLDRIRALGVEPITGNFIFESGLLRHNYDSVTETLLRLAQEHKRKLG